MHGYIAFYQVFIHRENFKFQGEKELRITKRHFWVFFFSFSFWSGCDRSEKKLSRVSQKELKRKKNREYIMIQYP